MQDIASIPEGSAQTMADLMDWVMNSACAAHDTQNALCNAASFGFSDTATMYKNIFKAIRSARDTLTRLMASLPEWLCTLEM